MSDLHLDPFSGLAGDMFLGACVDLGMPLEVLADATESLGLEGVTVEARAARRGAVAGTRFRVLLEGRPIEGPDPEERQADDAHAGTGEPSAALQHSDAAGAREENAIYSPRHEGGAPPRARGLPDIRRLLHQSGLSTGVRERAERFFLRLGAAEAQAHGTPIEQVHFHEVGAIDSIVDLVGAAAAIEYLAPARITSGPVNVGSGTVATAHGELPAPAPATVRLLTGMPVHGGPGGELVTPTGAVLLAELVDDFCELPAMIVEAHGYGLGRREIPGRPNAFRLWRGSAQEGAAEAEVVVIECQVDDLPGEGFGFLMERLLESGALDVYFTAVQMKKNRPGTLVTVLARRAALEPLAGLLLAESGSLGCRYRAAARFEAERRVVHVQSRYGEARVKLAFHGGRALSAAPEYEDCRRLAREQGISWREVYRAVLAAVPDDSG